MKNARPSVYQLPEQILKGWRTILATASLKEAEVALCRAGVRYALPPTTAPALLKAISLYLCDYQISSSIDPSCFLHRLSIKSEATTGIATSHPLFFAMTHTRGLPLLDNRFHVCARRLLSSYFSNVTEGAEAEILYQDIQQTRDVLKALADIQISVPDDDIIHDRFIIEKISKKLLGRPGVAADLTNKVRRFQQLYNGVNRLAPNEFTCRLPGIRIRHGASRRRGTSKRKRRDPGLTAALAASLAPRITGSPALTEKDEARLDQQNPAAAAWGCGVDPRSYHISASRAARAEALDERDIMIKRRTASLMTPADDQVVLRRAQRMAQVDSLLSMSDVQRLTPHQVSEALTGCRDIPTAWALALLLLATGMPVKRLSQLTRVAVQPGEPMPAPRSPYWNAEHQLLWYRLQDGPSYDADEHNGLVVLALPASINAALLSASTTAVSPIRPLLQALRLLDSSLERQFRHSGGLRPSPARLTASSWLLVRALARDDIAGMALRGQFDIAHRAPAAYRQLCPGELNDLFQSVLACLLPSPRASAVIYFPSQASPPYCFKAPSPLPAHLARQWITGSKHPRPVTEFRPWFAALRTAFHLSMERFLRPLLPPERIPEHLLSAVTYSAAYTYLTFLLSTGCRPHAQRVRCELQGKDLWIADKNTPHYRDSRVHPAVIELRQTLQKHQALLLAARWWLEFRGLHLLDKRVCGQLALPAYLHPVSKDQRTINVVPLEHRHFTKILTKCLDPQSSLDSPCQLPRNVTRHTVATFLRTRLPEPQLSALFGHVGSGFRQQAPGSTAPAPRRAELQTAISELLSNAGFKPLPYEEYINALCG